MCVSPLAHLFYYYFFSKRHLKKSLPQLAPAIGAGMEVEKEILLSQYQEGQRLSLARVADPDEKGKVEETRVIQAWVYVAKN